MQGGSNQRWHNPGTQLSVKFSHINNLFPGLARGLYLRQPAQEAQVQMRRRRRMRRWRRRRRRRRGLSAAEGGSGDQTQGSLIECRCPRRVLVWVCRYLILRLRTCFWVTKICSMKLQTFESALGFVLVPSNSRLTEETPNSSCCNYTEYTEQKTAFTLDVNLDTECTSITSPIKGEPTKTYKTEL